MGKFTIIIPSFNQGKYIGRTIDSILRQSGVEVQVIVSDGGSTDETVQVLETYGSRIEWWSEPDKGFADAVNKAIGRISGDYVGIQSSDDFYLPDTLAHVQREFERRRDVGIVSGGEIAIDGKGRIRRVNRGSGRVTPWAHIRNIMPQHSTFIRKEIFIQLGGVRASVDMCADADLWYRACHNHKAVRIPMLVGVYQLHKNQRTVTSDKWRDSLLKMVRDAEREFGERGTLTDEQKDTISEWWSLYWGSSIKSSDAKECAARALRRRPTLLRYKTLVHAARVIAFSRPVNPRDLLPLLISGAWMLMLFHMVVQRARAVRAYAETAGKLVIVG